MDILQKIYAQARCQRKHIVLPEAEDPRVLNAAVKAANDGIAEITLLGNRDKIHGLSRQQGCLLDAIALIDPALPATTADYAAALYARRKHKGMGQAQAASLIKAPLTCAAAMVLNGSADGMVAGAVHVTADVVRTALQVIGPKPACKLVSSFFLMLFNQPQHKRQGGLIFADCALVIEPDAEQLAEIALAAAQSARNLLDQPPRVAMLSFSTNASARHACVTKVADATAKLRAKDPNLQADGEVQLDAAIDPQVAAMKLPNSQTGGLANVLIFPNLDAGNIGYKLTERLAGATAIGPLLQGLNCPVNDLSRGCSEGDIYNVIAITAVQAQNSG